MARYQPRRPPRKPSGQGELNVAVVQRGPRDHSFQPVEFKCVVCGAQGCFGFGVKLREGQMGVWGCWEHRKEAEAKWKPGQSTL